MFSVGQMVYHRTREHSGKVLECDGDTVYLVQANGVETEFRISDMTATPPPLYYAPPPPVYYTPPQSYGPAPDVAPAGIGRAGAGQACYASAYVCPMDRPVAPGGSCYCLGNGGQKVWGRAN